MTSISELLSAHAVNNWLLLSSIFVGYLLGVKLVKRVSLKLRSIFFIKVLHLIVFVVISLLLFAFLFEVVTNQVGYFSLITISMFLAEGIVLIFNRWRCPLTDIAEGLGSAHGQVTDILLPKWFADRIFVIYTWLFVGGVVIVVGRLFW